MYNITCFILYRAQMNPILSYQYYITFSHFIPYHTSYWIMFQICFVLCLIILYSCVSHNIVTYCFVRYVCKCVYPICQYFYVLYHDISFLMVSLLNEWCYIILNCILSKCVRVFFNTKLYEAMSWHVTSLCCIILNYIVLYHIDLHDISCSMVLGLMVPYCVAFSQS